MIKKERSLPSGFCVGILTKYVMFDEVLHFLFYRKDYKDLLSLIRANLEKEKAKVVEIRGSLALPTLQAKINAKLKHEHHKASMTFWLDHYRSYCKKINSTLDHEEAEAFILT